jgi:hypothetical protein
MNKNYYLTEDSLQESLIGLTIASALLIMQILEDRRSVKAVKAIRDAGGVKAVDKFTTENMIHYIMIEATSNHVDMDKSTFWEKVILVHMKQGGVYRADWKRLFSDKKTQQKIYSDIINLIEQAQRHTKDIEKKNKFEKIKIGYKKKIK